MRISTLNKKAKLFFHSVKSENNIKNLIFAHSGGNPTPVSHTLHFGSKPGHIILYVDNDEIHDWVLLDPGYINYFRKDTDSSETNYKFNTLNKQKLLSQTLMFMYKGYSVSFSLFPFHIRACKINDEQLVVKDFFLFRKEIIFNFRTHTEKIKKWFYHKDVIKF